MTSEEREIRNVIVTPDMLKRYFSMNKTEILVHLFLLSVCDEDISSATCGLWLGKQKDGTTI